MIPAEIKKKENIAEYIIHMYQTEDLIKTFKLDLDEIFEYVIKHMSKDAPELKQLLLWYAELIEAMHVEKVIETGQRLESTQEYVKVLSSLHEKLLASDEPYRKIYDLAKFDIHNHIEASDGKIDDPIQVCLNAVYGKLLISLNGKKLGLEQEELVKRLAEVLAYLSKKYHPKEV